MPESIAAHAVSYRFCRVNSANAVTMACHAGT